MEEVGVKLLLARGNDEFEVLNITFFNSLSLKHENLPTPADVPVQCHVEACAMFTFGL